MADWRVPRLTLDELPGGRCRLVLCGLTDGEGQTLQEAADDLVERVVDMAKAVAGGAFGTGLQAAAPEHTLEFLHEVAVLDGEEDALRERILRGELP